MAEDRQSEDATDPRNAIMDVDSRVARYCILAPPFHSVIERQVPPQLGVVPISRRRPRGT